MFGGAGEINEHFQHIAVAFFCRVARAHLLAPQELRGPEPGLLLCRRDNRITDELDIERYTNQFVSRSEVAADLQSRPGGRTASDPKCASFWPASAHDLGRSIFSSRMA